MVNSRTRNLRHASTYADGQLNGVVPDKVGVKIVLFTSGRLLYRLCKITAPYFSSPENKWEKNQVCFFYGGSGVIPVTKRLLSVLPSCDFARSTRGSRDVGFFATGKRCMYSACDRSPGHRHFSSSPRRQTFELIAPRVGEI